MSWIMQTKTFFWPKFRFWQASFGLGKKAVSAHPYYLWWYFLNILFYFLLIVRSGSFVYDADIGGDWKPTLVSIYRKLSFTLCCCELKIELNTESLSRPEPFTISLICMLSFLLNFLCFFGHLYFCATIFFLSFILTFILLFYLTAHLHQFCG